jgi:hypothetical protein
VILHDRVWLGYLESRNDPTPFFDVQDFCLNSDRGQNSEVFPLVIKRRPQGAEAPQGNLF